MLTFLIPISGLKQAGNTIKQQLSRQQPGCEFTEEIVGMIFTGDSDSRYFCIARFANLLI